MKRLKATHVPAGEGKPLNRVKKGRHYSNKEPKTKISHSYPAIMPTHPIYTDQIPWDCECKWDYNFSGSFAKPSLWQSFAKPSRWQLKYYNTACPAKRAGTHE